MSRRLTYRFVLLAACHLLLPAARGEVVTTLFPTDDVFGYEFLPDTNFNEGAFGLILSAGETGPASPHSTKSVMKFDLSAITATPEQVVSATLELFVVDSASTGFGHNPTPANPVQVAIDALGPGAWSQGTVAWGTFPASAGLYSQAAVDTIGEAVAFDVKTLVQFWLGGGTNNGLLLYGLEPVVTDAGIVVAVFSSSESNVIPTLTITTVPEPSAVALALCGLPVLAWMWRRRGR